MIPGGGALAKDWLAAVSGFWRAFAFRSNVMLSKKFMAWVGVGLICVGTIPVLAAPTLARAVRRQPAVTKAAVPAKTPLKTPAKAAVVKTTVPHKVAGTLVKKTATKTSTATPSRLNAQHRTNAAHKLTVVKHKTITPAHKPVTATAHKPTTLTKKPVTAAHAATPTSTAKKLLH
jgi:hypothetical protein